MGDPIARLCQRLARLPGIGEKTASRLAFHIIRAPKAHARELAEALIDVVENVRLCSVCMNLTETEPCAMCRDARRDPHLLCVVASPSDVVAIDRSGQFRGRYHVLHGLLSPLEGIGPEDIRIRELVSRMAPAPDEDAIEEVILATSASVEGEATAMYVAKVLKPLGIAVSRIATGLPAGGEIEYSDQATIARALSGRARL